MNPLSSTRSMASRLILLPLAALVCFAALSSQAYAACGAMDGAKGPAARLPMFPSSENEPMFFNPTVVGLWHAIYTNSANNSVFNDSFKAWHVDGTEAESAFLNPTGGNVCMGAWKPIDFRKVKLHHTGWLFNPSTPTATATSYFTVDEFITVAPNGKTYSGTFTFKVWNLDGTPALVPGTSMQVQVTGTIEATRITV